MKWVFGTGLAVFGATVFNPNYTSRQSYYMRKFSIVFFFSVGFAWGKKKESDQIYRTMLQMHDYMPLEVKRTLATKDYRYMANFDWENPEFKLFDERTGKSLS